jgi:hypothetical protein
MGWGGSDGDTAAAESAGFGGGDGGYGGGSSSEGLGGFSFGGWGDPGDSTLGGFSFGGWGDTGAGTNFGDVGFGPGGKGYAGQGFLDANTAAAGIGDYADISNKVRSMTPAEQQMFMSTVVEPTLSKYSGNLAAVGQKVAGFVMSGLLNGLIPGVGTLAQATGLIGKVTEGLMNMAAMQDIGVQLGVRTNTDFSLSDLNGSNSQKVISDFIKKGNDMGLWSDITGKTAANASTNAANTEASYQQQALDYLKQREALPIKVGEGATSALAGLYGLPGGTGTQEQNMQELINSPIYQAMMGGKSQGEEAILRNAGSTGGLRSGNVQGAMYDYNTNLNNQAIMSTLQGLTGMANMNPGANPNVANTYSGIGNTLGQGQIAAANADQQGTSNLIGLAGSLLQNVGGIKGIASRLGGMYNAYNSSASIGTNLTNVIGSLF